MRCEDKHAQPNHTHTNGPIDDHTRTHRMYPSAASARARVATLRPPVVLFAMHLLARYVDSVISSYRMGYRLCVHTTHRGPSMNALPRTNAME